MEGFVVLAQSRSGVAAFQCTAGGQRHSRRHPGCKSRYKIEYSTRIISVGQLSPHRSFCSIAAMAVLLMGFIITTARLGPSHTRLSCRGTRTRTHRIRELERVRQSRARETVAAYDACRFSFLSKDYFARFTRDPAVVPNDGEVLLSANWKIAIPEDAQPLTRIMAEHGESSGRMRIDLAMNTCHGIG